MNVAEFLDNLQRDRYYQPRLVHVEHLPARPAQHADPAQPLHPVITDALSGDGIDRLWAHQAAAIDAVRAGKNVVVVTGTASGKTMAYNLPVVQSLLTDPDSRALYIFPTKALAQDQLGTLNALAGRSDALTTVLRPATYDGDTPTHQRTKIRRAASVILTNPDMLHQGILPYHGRWAQFLSRLKYVVLDEIHTYRGLFGSHVAGVLRRLQRVCEHYGSSPQFICCSATIANPTELAQRLIHQPVDLIDNDGSPRGRKFFVLWNPPLLDEDTFQRRSANIEAQQLMRRLIESGAQTITFAKARVVAELIYRYLRDDLVKTAPRLADRVKPYRGGYLPQHRREIEKALFSGELLGVCSTNALELGIDVGSLDAAIIVGFPSTVCSTWQQAGRAGRRNDESLAVLIAYDDPIDQYMMRHPEYFFGQSAENAIIDPENPFILERQLACAASELPVGQDDADLFGPVALALCEQERQANPDGCWTQDRGTGDYRYHERDGAVPATRVGLRMMSNDTYAIVDKARGKRDAIGQVDAISAPELVYPHAIYLHEGESYIVRDLDLDAKIAYVEPIDADYYTQPVLANDCRILETRRDEPYRSGHRFYGRLDVTWQTTAFKKIKYYTMEMIGQTALDLPPLNIDTTGLWLTCSPPVLGRLKDAGIRPADALVGLKNLMLTVLPHLAMCDGRDISGLLNSANLGKLAIFVYDRYPGGLGFAQKGYELLDDWLAMCRAIVTECPCAEGCPSCVGLANLRPPLHQDPDLGAGYPIPDKLATATLLSTWLG